MELLQLKYFCDAAVTENFSETAKKFNVPPSNISQSIRRLEREFSVNLFERHANKIQLNERGREFYRRVSEALKLLGDASALLADNGEVGKIKVCINANRRAFIKVMEHYKRIYPNVDIIAAHFADPASDEFDLIIESEDERLRGYDKQLLISEKIKIALHNSSPYASKPELSVLDLKEASFVSMSPVSSLFGLTKSICADFGFEPHIAIQSDDPFYVRKCVELGLGVAFIPEFSWHGQLSKNVICRDLPGYVRNTYVYTNPRKYMPKCTRLFLEMLVAELGKQSEKNE
jgi:DNA-binding transcriptional LysR family regulator